MKKQKIATVITCCALVGAVAVGGTLALLTSESKTLQNTFTVGSGYDDEDFLLKEHGVDQIVTDAQATQAGTGYKVGDYKANATEKNGTTGTPGANNGNTYAEVIPGAKLDKDPWFELAAGAPASWVVACVPKADIEAMTAQNLGITSISSDWLVATKGADGTWTTKALATTDFAVAADDNYKTTEEDKVDDYIYFVYNGFIDTDTNTEQLNKTNPLFTQLTAGTNLVEWQGDLNLNIKGVAVQKLEAAGTLEDSLQTIMGDAVAKLAV